MKKILFFRALLVLVFILPFANIKTVFAAGPTHDNHETAPMLAGPYSISGTVTLTGMTDHSGVTVTCNSYSATTNAAGAYTITGVPSGTDCWVTPVKDGYSFTNPTYNAYINNLSSNRTGVNFTGTLITYRIKGKVTMASGGAALSGVTLTCGSYSGTSGGDGKYTIYNVPYGTSCTVTPTKTGYTFNAPANAVITNLNSDKNGVDFLATRVYTISGTVTLTGASDHSGVTVTCGIYSATTNSGGAYTILNVPQGTTCTAIPAKTGYTFSPASVTITNLTADRTGVDFTGTLNTYTIGGTVTLAGGTTPLGGVTVTCGSLSDDTDGDGLYVILNVPHGTSCAVTPAKTGYTFSPASISVDNISANQSGVNFSATLNTYTIGGTVTLAGGTTPLGGVTVTCGTLSDDTGGDGVYAIENVPHGTSCVVTPAKMGYTFSPASIPVDNIAANQSGVDFAATLNTYEISGTVTSTTEMLGLGGVTVTCGSLSDDTDVDGKYVIENVPYGTSCTVTPVKLGYEFSPASIPVDNITANQSGVDFSGAYYEYTIEGTVTLTPEADRSGILVTCGAFSDETDADGKYAISGIPSGTSCLAAPEKLGYEFTPPNVPISNLTANRSGVDFTGTYTTYTIGGTVTLAGGTTPLSDVIVTCGALVDDTDADGKYTISEVPSGTTCAVTPAKTGYTFSPANIPLSHITANQSGVDFSATINTYTISGTVTLTGASDHSGVTVTCGAYSDDTDAAGEYTIIGVPHGTSCAVTPAKAEYWFNPVNLPISSLTGDQSGMNFTGTLNTYTIEGWVTLTSETNHSDVIVTCGGKSDDSDAMGFYRIEDVPSGTSCAVTPLKLGYEFTPPNVPVSNITANQSGVDFSGTYHAYTIAGTVTLAGASDHSGVTVACGTRSAVSQPDGTYSISDVPSGTTCEVTPEKLGYIFTPANIPVSNLTADQSGVDFSGTYYDYTIEGWVTLTSETDHSGVTVACGPASDETGADGYYAIENVPHGTDCTVTPTKAGWGFNLPGNAVVDHLSANLSDVNFTGTFNTYTLGGTVKLPDASGLSGVTLTCGIYTVDTDSNGVYAISGVPYGTSCTMTPAKTGYTFSPVDIAVGPLSASRGDLNFTATLNTYTIGGTVTLTGASDNSGVTVTCGAYSDDTDTAGVYTIPGVPHGTTCALTPAKTGYEFSPANVPVSNLSANVSGVNFTGMLTTYTLSGTIRLTGVSDYSGVTVACGAYTAPTNAAGAYAISGIPYGTSCTVVPVKSGYRFNNPLNATIPVMTGSQGGVSFTGRPIIRSVAPGTTIKGVAPTFQWLDGNQTPEWFQVVVENNPKGQGLWSPVGDFWFSANAANVCKVVDEVLVCSAYPFKTLAANYYRWRVRSSNDPLTWSDYKPFQVKKQTYAPAGGQGSVPADGMIEFRWSELEKEFNLGSIHGGKQSVKANQYRIVLLSGKTKFLDDPASWYSVGGTGTAVTCANSICSITLGNVNFKQALVAGNYQWKVVPAYEYDYDAGKGDVHKRVIGAALTGEVFSFNVPAPTGLLLGEKGSTVASAVTGVSQPYFTWSAPATLSATDKYEVLIQQMNTVTGAWKKVKGGEFSMLTPKTVKGVNIFGCTAGAKCFYYPGGPTTWKAGVYRWFVRYVTYPGKVYSPYAAGYISGMALDDPNATIFRIKDPFFTPQPISPSGYNTLPHADGLAPVFKWEADPSESVKSGETTSKYVLTIYTPKGKFSADVAPDKCVDTICTYTLSALPAAMTTPTKYPNGYLDYGSYAFSVKVGLLKADGLNPAIAKNWAYGKESAKRTFSYGPRAVTGLSVVKVDAAKNPKFTWTDADPGNTTGFQVFVERYDATKVAWVKVTAKTLLKSKPDVCAGTACAVDFSKAKPWWNTTTAGSTYRVMVMPFKAKPANLGPAAIQEFVLPLP